MNNLRKVEVTHVIESQASNHPGVDIRHEKEVCYFHKFSGGYMSENVAIVETEDGRVFDVALRLMKFIK